MRVITGDNDASPATQRAGQAWWRAAAETALIAAIFASAGAWPVPDVNETVYLTKARHAADPTWGRGDFFLETPDAHGAFYLLMGPLAAALPLEQAAWVGRILGWMALAVGCRHALAALVGPGWPRLVAAAVFSLALRHTTAAGEWVIGGCEAKVFAWAFVLGSLGELFRGRFPSSSCLLGAATAVHPIVGGWSAVAALAAGIAVSRPRQPQPWAVRTVLIALALALAAAGVVPALGLSAGDAVQRAEAARIYVVERLPHHLLVRAFAAGMVARHVLAVLVWWLVWRSVPPSPARARLAAFTAAALGISLAGCVISLLEQWAPAAAFGLLRYYWFRLADVAVPFALGAAVAVVLADDVACRRLCGMRPAAARLVAVALLGLDLAVESGHWPLPGRSGPAPRSDAKVQADAWADICGWVRDHAPADACFITPRGAASFTWLTGRREVVSWKNSPQDAASLIAWRRRIIDCFSRDGGMADLERSTSALGAERMRLVAERYGADHAIVPRDAPGAAELPFPRLHANARYTVHAITASPASPDRRPDGPPAGE
ncbi:MAG: hypothetical protein DWI03_10005 [Planctomycetota bacterium]|nr:MAG: hypothetical protein DWI03_10005 [Planctomycetota bacterium]